MRQLSRITLAAITVAALGLGALVIAQAQDAPTGDAAAGKRIFLNMACFTCHGRSGQGGAYNGPAPVLAHTPLPFEGFIGQVRNPSNDMPAYSTKILSDKDVADIYAFVELLPGSRSPKNISILNN